MQAFIISLALKLILKLILNQVTLDRLLEMVGNAESLFGVSEEKRDYVRSRIIDVEGDNKSSHLYNFIIEAAVMLYKNYK